MKLRALLLAFVAGAAPTSPAYAEKEPIRVRAGLGPDWSPKFPGADENKLGPLIDVSIAKGDKLFDFEAPDDSFDIEVVSVGRFSAGPVANLQSSRKNSDVGALVGKVSTTIEAGGFAEFDVSDSIRLRGEVRRGLGGHEGVISGLGADYVWRDADKYQVSIGPRLLISNAQYQRAYFGVTPDASTLTGLPTYRPDGGLFSVGATAGLFASISPKFGAFGYARYERLVGDAKRSPIVSAFGSANQYSAGVGLTYTFWIWR